MMDGDSAWVIAAGCGDGGINAGVTDFFFFNLAAEIKSQVD